VITQQRWLIVDHALMMRLKRFQLLQCAESLRFAC